MKKTLIAAAAIVGLAAQMYGQGTIYLNNWDSNKGIFWGDGSSNAPAGTKVQLLGGPALSPVPTAGTTTSMYTLLAGDVGALGAGMGSSFDYGYGKVPGTTSAQAGVPLELRAWFGGTGWDDAVVRGKVTWSQTLGTDPPPPSTPVIATLNMPSALRLQPVPEPSTFALAGLGLASLVIFRRRK